MRCELVALAFAACGYTDVDRPIGLVPHDLPDEWVANLEEAGACWNLEFGTHFVTGDDALHADQQVDVRFDHATCLQAPAQVQPGMPTMLGICPPRYWPGLDGPYLQQYITPFRVLSHELGHVVNMLGHPDDATAVMRSGDLEFRPMFHAVDRQRFIAANPDFATSSPCQKLIRSYRAGTGGTVSHCACDTGELDVTRPIALVPSAELSAGFVDGLVHTATCWNVRYGLDLAVRAPQPGDIRVDFELDPVREYGVHRVVDRDSVLMTMYRGFDLDAEADGMVAYLFDVPASYPFLPETDAAMASRYNVGVQCQTLMRDFDGCTCAD